MIDSPGFPLPLPDAYLTGYTRTSPDLLIAALDAERRRNGVRFDFDSRVREPASFTLGFYGYRIVGRDF